jgi:cell division protein FtsB
MNMLGRSIKYIAVLGGLFTLAFLVIVFNNRIAEQRQLVVQAEKIQTELEALQATDAYLDAQITYATSDAAVEEWAYQEARWVREGDQPIVPISPSESTPAAIPAVTPEPVLYANWQIWWALFFDDLPEVP